MIVFLRGVNVGGHKTFRPAEVAKKLAKLGAKNHGAAGTYSIHAQATESAVRAAFEKALPFEADMMICPRAAIEALVKKPPFGKPAKDQTWYVSVLGGAPKLSPTLPLERPEKDWEVRVLRVEGPFVCSLHRRRPNGRHYPNEVVEKAFGVPATTRNWNTILKLCS